MERPMPPSAQQPKSMKPNVESMWSGSQPMRPQLQPSTPYSRPSVLQYRPTRPQFQSPDMESESLMQSHSPVKLSDEPMIPPLEAIRLPDGPIIPPHEPTVPQSETMKPSDELVMSSPEPVGALPESVIFPAPSEKLQPEPPESEQPSPGSAQRLPRPELHCPSGYRQITVDYDEGFSMILRQYNVSYDAMATANPGVNLLRLKPGQRLCVPPWGTHTICAGKRTHTIKPGENLDSLARSFRASVGSILRANPSMAPTDFVPDQIICRP